MKTETPTDIATLFAGELTTHPYDQPSLTYIPDGESEARTFQCFNLGLSGLLLGDIHGDSRSPNNPGHPRLTIEQAAAIRAEIIRRWNAFPSLFNALDKLLNECDHEAFTATGCAKAEMLFDSASTARSELVKLITQPAPTK